MVWALDTTTSVKIVGACLVVFGLAVAGVTVWYWKSARPEPEALAALEVMSSKKFSDVNPLDQQRLLDEVRPDGSAAPIETVRMAMRAVVLATQAEKIERERQESEQAQAEIEAIAYSDEYLDDHPNQPTTQSPIDPLLG